MSTEATLTDAPVLIARPASFGRRLAAVIIDAILSMFITIPIGMVFDQPLAEGTFGDRFHWTVGSAIGNLVIFVLVGFLESSQWQATPGKILMSLKVTDVLGERISFGRALLRELAKIPSGLLLLLGYFAMLWDKEKRTWHDRWSGTRVRHYPDPKEKAII